MNDQDYFGGPERIAIFEPSGRPMRMGEPSELAVSNYDRVLDALNAGDLRKATEYIALQRESNATMVSIYLQWPCAYLLAAEDSFGAQAAQALAAAAFDHWSKAVQSIAAQGIMEQSVVARATPLLHPARLTPAFARGIIDAINAGRSPDDMTTATEMLEGFDAQLSTFLAQGDMQKAMLAYDEYFSCARSWHDVLMQYADSFPSVAALEHGQASAEALVDKSFSMAPFGAGLWAFGSRLSPKQLAAFLLAHIRDHFSGPDRKGAATLQEYEDRYELTFDPCGSGGAMRRRLGSAQTRLPSASPATFSRAGEVPPYCTHCAINARTAIARFGWPIYITHFDPNPARPCGWTIYKAPDAIPDQHFEEIGYTKEPPKFRLAYWMTA